MTSASSTESPSTLDTQLQQLAEACAASLPARFEALTQRLLAAGVVLVTCAYSGCGDDGNIDCVDCFADGEEPISKPEVELLKPELEQFFDDVLMARHSGYENNDGGEGSFTWIVKDRSIAHEHSDFYTERDTTSHEGLDDLLSGEPS